MIYIAIIVILLKNVMIPVIAGKIKLPARHMLMITYSTDPDEGRMKLLMVAGDIYEAFAVGLLFSAVTSMIFDMGGMYVLALVLPGVVLNKRVISPHGRNRIRLLEETGDFLHSLEMLIAKGENVRNALGESVKSYGFYKPDENKDAGQVIDGLYDVTGEVIFRKISLIIDRLSLFEDEDISLEFLGISEEVSRIYFEERMLGAEKRENEMLIPMVLNMVLMIVSLLTPFLIEMKGG